MNPLKPTEQECSDILITAFDSAYGGCWYWARPEGGRESWVIDNDGQSVNDLYRAVHIVESDDDGPQRVFVVDHAVITRGLRRLVEGDCTFGGKPWENRKHILGSLSDPGDIDAGIADVIVQAGLWGDIVYG